MKEVSLRQYGFFRVAAVSPLVSLGDVDFNVRNTFHNAAFAVQAKGAQLIVFPELNLTGYTLRDLFQQTLLQKKALQGLRSLLEMTVDIPAIIAVGLPLVVDDMLFNVAALCYHGEVLAFVPKSYIPNYREFEERRWFKPAKDLRSKIIAPFGYEVPIGTDILIETPAIPGLTIGTEVCEDVWMPIPPSSYQALNGATVMINLSASNAVIGKADYRRSMVGQHSANVMGAYIYASCGVGESTSDVVFDGHSMIYENGRWLAETTRFAKEGDMIVADVDLEYIVRERLVNETFSDNAADNVKEFRRVICGLHHLGDFLDLNQYNEREVLTISTLTRSVDAHPFVPKNPATLDERSKEIFHIQVMGLVQRLKHLSAKPWWKKEVTIGISGGLDSTLALLVVVQAFDLLGWDRKGIKALTMPGFGTSSRTLHNAESLCEELGVSLEIRSIVEAAEVTLRSMGHEPCKEKGCYLCANEQARIRTNILMTRGFTVGTGDMSEAALGWCTFGGDQLSMYNVNAGVPKTLVKHIVNWTAKNNLFGEEVSTILLDIIDTPISPELESLDKDGQVQEKTEERVGPYELNDFFLYHFLRNGYSPAKIFFLATLAEFDVKYDKATIKKWLVKFFQRFFDNQFKRDANPNGTKVGSVALGQRGDWRMPSDAEVKIWAEDAASIPV